MIPLLPTAACVELSGTVKASQQGKHPAQTQFAFSASLSQDASTVRTYQLFLVDSQEECQGPLLFRGTSGSSLTDSLWGGTLHLGLGFLFGKLASEIRITQLCYMYFF